MLKTERFEPIDALMFRNLKLRTKLIAIAGPALVVLAIVSGYAVMLSSQGSTSLADLERDIRTLGIVSMAAVLLSALTMVIIGRSIVDPIEGLKRSALDVANERLPLLVEAIRDPSAGVPPFEPLTNDHDDELGELVDALNTIQDRVVEIASAQQSAVHAGVSDLVVNLARRNQSLIDRQLERIDRLEHDEQDPQRLEELFGLDHLATRMRRNAESLLVLAGSEPARRRGEPVEVSDAIRVAMSEIEDYQHVTLTEVEPTRIDSAMALDLAHLLSELMENATQFSPPERPVEVRGSRQPDGGYTVAVIDRGIGISSEGLADATETLAMPPELSLGMGRSLGFVVVGHLARRLGATVSLAPTPGGGTTATVVVAANRLAESVIAPQTSLDTPAEVAQAQPVTEPVADPLAMFREDNHPVNTEPAPAPASAPAAAPAPVPAQSTVSGYPDKLSDAVPDGVAFDVGVETLLRPQESGQSQPNQTQPNQTQANQTQPNQTSSGLTKRDRTTSTAPTDEGRPASPSRRSPQEIRSMLSRYRNGLKGRPLSDLSAAPSDATESITAPAFDAPDHGDDE